MKLRSSLTLVMLASLAGGCGTPLKQHNLPPAQQLMEPGPGVGGPGPGVLPPVGPPMLAGPVVGLPGPTAQIWFAQPEGAQVRWDVGMMGGFVSAPLVTPGRQNFPMGGIYRLKLTNIEGRPGVELYPTLEISPATPRTIAYLEHNAIPIQFTDEDFAQVLAGNMVTKVIYLPDPEFQELVAGVETLVSTRLDPGLDPIVEADRRGAILAIVRMGNKDLETPAIGGGFGPMLGVPGAPLPGYPTGPVGPGYPAPPAGTPGTLVPGAPAAPISTPTGDPNISPAAHNLGATADAGSAPTGVPVNPISGPYAGAPVAPIGGPYGMAPVYPTYPHMGAMGGPVPYGPAAMPPPYVVGVTAPTYGYPITGTPIGLPGPPHIPLGVPAGLQRHTMTNHTHVHLPQPTHAVGIHVKQRPGFSYPRPASHVFIQEQMIHPAPSFHQPPGNKFKLVH
jgi:hypothetical protein